MTPFLPNSSEELSPSVLTALLGKSIPGVEVTKVEIAAIGTGQMGDSIRLLPVYKGEVAGPSSLIAKLPSTNAQSRATAWALRSYEIEVRFYQEMAEYLSIRTPACYAAEIDIAAERFTIIMEDLAPAIQGDQITGCTVDQADAALQELPKLHTPRWGDPTLGQLEWLARPSSSGPDFIAALYPGFCERFGDLLTQETVSMGERLMNNLAKYYESRKPPFTIQHGDYRLDNLLFATNGDSPRVAVVDWQVMSNGPALSDVSYFLGSALLPDERAKNEKDLVAGYHSALLASGITDYAWNSCWDDYRRYSFAGFIMAVAASMIVVQTERGDAMFLAMAHRHSEQILALEAEKLLG